MLHSKGRSLSQALRVGNLIPTGIWPTVWLHQAEQIDQLVANETGISTEENSQKQASSKPVQEMRFGEKNQREDSQSGHCKLGGDKEAGAAAKRGLHERIGLDHASRDQFQCQKRVGTGEQHRANGEKEQPGMVPIEEYYVTVDVAPVQVTSRQGEAKNNSAPAKAAPVFPNQSLFIDHRFNLHARCFPFLLSTAIGGRDSQQVSH